MAAQRLVQAHRRRRGEDLIAATPPLRSRLVGQGQHAPGDLLGILRLGRLERRRQDHRVARALLVQADVCEAGIEQRIAITLGHCLCHGCGRAVAAEARLEQLPGTVA